MAMLSMRLSGIPHSPKPPTQSVRLSLRPADEKASERAEAGEGDSFDTGPEERRRRGREERRSWGGVGGG